MFTISGPLLNFIVSTQHTTDFSFDNPPFWIKCHGNHLKYICQIINLAKNDGIPWTINHFSSQEAKILRWILFDGLHCHSSCMWNIHIFLSLPFTWCVATVHNNGMNLKLTHILQLSQCLDSKRRNVLIIVAYNLLN